MQRTGRDVKIGFSNFSIQRFNSSFTSLIQTSLIRIAFGYIVEKVNYYCNIFSLVLKIEKSTYSSTNDPNYMTTELCNALGTLLLIRSYFFKVSNAKKKTEGKKLKTKNPTIRTTIFVGLLGC